MPRKYELTFQRGADGRTGRWKKFYRGKAHYLGAGRSKSDIESYRTALDTWKKLKVQLDAELIPIPRAYDSDYDEVIREWELVLAWSVQHGANDEAVVAREKLAELRTRREKPRQLPVTHHDRLWSRLRPAPEDLRKIADIAVAHQGESLDAFREAMMKRPYVAPTPVQIAPAHPIDRVDPFQRAEIEWQDRLANQSKVVASDDSRSLGGWIRVYLVKEQRRVGAGGLSPVRFASIRGALFFFRDWAGAAVDASSISGQTLSRYHSHLLGLVGNEKCSPTYAKDRMVSLKTFIRWLWGQDVIESLPKNIDSRELQFTRRIVTPETMSHDEVRTLLSGTTGLLRLCILLGLNCGMTQKDISDLLDKDVDWKEGRITRKRSKTSSHEGVPVVSYKLWPETIQLMRELRSGTEVVLLTPKGTRLLQQHLNQNGSLNKCDSVKPLYLRECERLSFKKPFKLLRKTSATLINSNPQSRGLDQLFLGHAPSSIADKHYVATAKSALDEALEWLREEYRLGTCIERLTNNQFNPGSRTSS